MALTLIWDQAIDRVSKYHATAILCVFSPINLINFGCAFRRDRHWLVCMGSPQKFDRGC